MCLNLPGEKEIAKVTHFHSCVSSSESLMCDLCENYRGGKTEVATQLKHLPLILLFVTELVSLQ